MFNKITIIGAGYVGFSLAVLLSQEKEVTLFDIDRLKLKQIGNKKSPLRDQNIDPPYKLGLLIPLRSLEVSR